ncbi:AraC family transcriptional regulator [Megasphaera butyrica]|uniref:helix-turn-helix domain-containing protein n=1 Tax=Megasphaera butyrica TaxID=2981791 RepID=UPI00082318A6|nr:AraC family transcriptional regulator [Megasphaera butyrica]MCU6714163.1 AraC family transcriptional regulator [Megasphaera butyrica]SCH41635.1 L-rhamnose operon regulatory protein rhaS [uncultured Megasphaera sp.]SCJ08501.1 L-rhamnose operon regulatory protein rhaS [uncultured Ruminococcus sp.]
MRKEIKTLVYDEELRLEAYRFEGMSKAFPNHFHDYYVIGLIEKGERRLWCRHQEYTIGTGQILLFNPGDTHACVQADGCALDYRGLNIPKEVMLDLAEEITGNRTLPGFSPAVLCDEEVSCYLRPLHDLVLNGSLEFGKEESLLLMLSLLMQRYGQPFEECIPECREEIERACAFMEEHAAERISLDQICREAGLSKSTLLRAFAKSKGVAPYCYLESLRIGRAKKLLEQGMSPMEAALQTGFSDQSHFTNYFARFIGVTPGAYRDIFLKSSGTGGEGQASP